MSAKHTPGPWSYAIPGDSFVGSDRGLICKRPAVSGGGDAPKSWDDNARLIAAAPDMLAALQEVAEWDKVGAFPCVHAAIAKAIG